MKLSNEGEYRRKRVILFRVEGTNGTRPVILTRARRSERETTSESRAGRTRHNRGIRPHTETRRSRPELTNIRHALPITVRETTYGTRRPMGGERRPASTSTAPEEAGETGAGNGAAREERVGEGEHLLAPDLLERDSPPSGRTLTWPPRAGQLLRRSPTPDVPAVEDPCTEGTPPEVDAPVDTEGTGTAPGILDPSPGPAPGTAPANKGLLNTLPLESRAMVNPTTRLAKICNAGSGAEGAAERALKRDLELPWTCEAELRLPCSRWSLCQRCRYLSRHREWSEKRKNRSPDRLRTQRERVR